MNTESSTLSKCVWLLADNNIIYKKPIMPFSQYLIMSKLKSDPTDDKWFTFTHTFTKRDDLSFVYAEINCRMVIKEPSGKTVRASAVLAACPDLKKFIEGSR